MTLKFSTWPRLHKYWLFTLVLGFWLCGFIFSLQHGNKEYSATDETTEQMIMHSSEVYVRDGFTKTALLPTSPAFGFDDEGKIRTTDFVYTHYFPGPYWVAGIMRSIFSDNYLWLTRLIPLAMNVAGVFLVAIEFGAFASSSLLACILASLILTCRSVTVFSICIAGHGYVMGAFLILCAYLFRIANKIEESKEVSKVSIFLVSGFIGFFQIWFSIDFLSVTFLAALGLVLVTGKIGKAYFKSIAFGMIAGGCFGMALQIALYSIYLGSVGAVVENFIKWGTWRMGLHNFNQTESIVEKIRLSTVLREYNRQAYGATGFTAYNLLSIGTLFLILGYAAKLFESARLKQLALGLVFGYLGAISWNVLMRQHSHIHVFFIPRHYFVLFFITVVLVSLIARDLVNKARNFQAIDEVA